MKKLLFYIVLATTFHFVIPGYSAELPIDMAEKTILIISGKLKSGTKMEFNLNDLMGLPQTSFSVTSRRTNKQDTYRGVGLRDLLDHVTDDTDNTTVKVVADNDYNALISIEDIQRYEYLLSYKKNGLFYWDLELSENKGPLAIAINFDNYPQMEWEIYKHQLVWFVKEIIIQ